MSLQLFNSMAILDLAVIDPAQVALLDDNQQAHLASLIDAVKIREAATERLRAAQIAVIDSTREQLEAMEAHAKANPPPTFQQSHAAAVDAFNKSH